MPRWALSASSTTEQTKDSKESCLFEPLTSHSMEPSALIMTLRQCEGWRSKPNTQPKSLAIVSSIGFRPPREVASLRSPSLTRPISIKQEIIFDTVDLLSCRSLEMSTRESPPRRQISCATKDVLAFFWNTLLLAGIAPKHSQLVFSLNKLFLTLVSPSVNKLFQLFHLVSVLVGKNENCHAM